ncbi:MAG: efflux RND transporter periplasmic adaptor subunit [Flavobacteriales bacterium]
MRKTILTIIGIVIIFISIQLCNIISKSKKAPKKNTSSVLKTVTTKTVENTKIPVEINSTGSIMAKDRMVIYSEVQGVFQRTSTPFKAGTKYRAGQTLIGINNSEFVASVKSQRIAFKGLITSTLADIQFDYPTELAKWKSYVSSISADKSLPKLPEIKNESFVNYITGKNIYSNYYSIKNLETRLAKYTISAPFSGVLVEANITPGTLVSPGQKLGEFIKPGIYELELNVNASLSNFLKIGKIVMLESIDKSNTYKGRVSRINPQIDRASQTLQLFVEIRSNELKEGEYLKADIKAQEIENVFEFDRKLLVDESFVFILKDSLLVKQPVAIVHSGDNSVIVKGLTDRSQLVTLPMPNGYEGMKVSPKN